MEYINVKDYSNLGEVIRHMAEMENSSICYIDEYDVTKTIVLAHWKDSTDRWEVHKKLDVDGLIISGTIFKDIEDLEDVIIKTVFALED